MESRTPPPPRRGSARTQREKKQQRKEKIRQAVMWSPPEDWQFDVEDIPGDQNLDDLTVGMLELARDQGEVSKKTLLANFPLTYTESGIVRKDRATGGKSFIGPDGKHVLLGSNFLLGDDKKLRAGTYTINNLQTAKNFYKWKQDLFKPKSSNKRQHSPDRGGKITKKHPKHFDSSSSSEQNGDNEDEGEDGDDFGDEFDAGDRDENENQALKSPRTQRSSRQKHKKFMIKIGALGEKTGEEQGVEDLKQTIEIQNLKIKGLEESLADSEKREDKVQKVLQENIQHAALLGAKSINSVAQEAMIFCDYLEENTNGGGDYFLGFYQRCLEKNLEELKEFRHTLQEPEDLVMNPSGDKARVAQGMISDAMKEELKREEAAALQEIADRRQILP